MINVALPAAAFHSVHNLTIRSDWWLAVATPWLDVVFAIAVIVPLGRALRWSRQRTGAVLLASGRCNTAFLGLPLIIAYAGEKFLALGLVIDLCGSYLAVSTLGIADRLAREFGPIQLARGCQADRDLPAFPRDPARFRHQSSGSSDVAHGNHRRARADADTARDGGGGLCAAAGPGGRPPCTAVRRAGLPAVAGPVGSCARVLALGQAGDPVAKVAMLEMAMPPMLGASIIAMEYDLEPDLIALLIGDRCSVVAPDDLGLVVADPGAVTGASTLRSSAERGSSPGRASPGTRRGLRRPRRSYRPAGWPHPANSCWPTRPSSSRLKANFSIRCA